MSFLSSMFTPSAPSEAQGRVFCTVVVCPVLMTTLCGQSHGWSHLHVNQEETDWQGEL